MAPTPGNEALLQALSKVSEDLGYGPVSAYDPGKRGAADVSFVADYVDAIDGIGARDRRSLDGGADRFIDAADVNRTRRRLDVPVVEKRWSALMLPGSPGSVGRLFGHGAKISVPETLNATLDALIQEST